MLRNAPMFHEGKRLVYEDRFVAPHEYPTQSDALYKLNAIRTEMSAPGWVEIDSEVKQLPNGKWHVEYLRAKYE